MEQMNYGPNGGLVYCMEYVFLIHFINITLYYLSHRYLLQNSEWLKDELDKFGDDDYVILDCPGNNNNDN